MKRILFFVCAVVVCVVVFLSVGAWSANAAELFHLDAFDQGTSTLGWTGGAAPRVISTGGPQGDGDAFLQISANGGNGPGSRLAMYNVRSHWTGSYADAGVAAIRGDFMNPTTSSSALALRLVLFGPGSTNDRWTSSTAIDLPNDGVWRNLEFPIDVDSLTRVRGTSDYDGMLDNVLRLMVRHDPNTPSAQPEPVDARLGIDNLLLFGENVVFPDANGDGVADVSDFNIWNANKNISGTDITRGDFNGDGQTNARDFEIWNDARFTVNPNAAQPAMVPEPVGVACWWSLLGLVGWLRRVVAHPSLSVSRGCNRAAVS